MNQLFRRYLQICLILLDLVLLNTSYIIAIILLSFINEHYVLYDYLILAVTINICWVFTIFLTGLYIEKTIIHFEPFIKHTLQVYLLWIISVLSFLFFVKSQQISRYFILIFMLLFAISLLFNRFIYVGIRNYFKKRFYFFNRVMIVGYNETSAKLASYFEEDAINSNLIGFAEDEIKISELTHYPILSNLKEAIKTATKLDVQEVFSTITPEQNLHIYSLMNQAEKACIRFKIVPNLSFFLNKPIVVDYIRDLPILSLRNEPLEDVGNRVKKRMLDITISLFVSLFFLSWMIPLIGLLILIDSKGPIFFSQKRTGKNNKPFNCLKFRSMKINQDSDNLQATKSDARITKIGKILRKTSLDEFPQFINVIIGEMSIVGPRPHMVKHTSDYSKIIDEYMIRHFLKPGITGWAQIKGYRGEITNPIQIKMRVANDLWYLENWNVWLDIKIIFLTIYSVFKGDKNAF